MDDEFGQGARFYCEQDMARAEVLAVCGGSAAVYTAKCPGRQTANEDAAAIIPYDAASAILSVADGLGGGPLGNHASALALRTLQRSLAEGAREGLMLRSAVLNGIDAANQAVLASGTGAATTLAVVELHETAIRPYHVGDSTILLIGQRGKVKLQTTSHSPVGFGVEAGLLDALEAMHHEDRHLVSNVIGSPEMRIEIGPLLRLAPRDTVLLASDGLFDNLHLEEIVQRIRKGPLDDAARRLADDATERMTTPRDTLPCKPDDLTFVLFRPLFRSHLAPRDEAPSRGARRLRYGETDIPR